MNKTLNNTTANQAKVQVSDLQIWGDGDTFKLICKASSKQEGWMKSTKAMEIPGVGCVVQVTTQQRNDFPKGEGYQLPHAIDEPHTWSVAEAVTFVPGVRIHEVTTMDGDGVRTVTSRRLVAVENKYFVGIR